MTAPLRETAPGAFAARLAATGADLRAAQALRHLCFVEARGLPARPGGLDRDRHDAACLHLLVERAGQPVATARLRPFADGRGVRESYAAESYDLARLARYARPMMEVGRLCVRPGEDAAAVLRLAWGAMTALALARGVGLLFGCCSFEGTDPAPHRAAFAHLARHHAAPEALAPLPRATERVPLAGPEAPRRAEALRAIPPLLRGYLAMGGWVSDHAVVDRAMGTLHVLTAVEAARLPPARARALAALAAGVG
jgi:putative hemolysin